MRLFVAFATGGCEEETLLNFWAKKVVTVTFMNRCKDIIANNEDVSDNVEGVEEDGDVDDDDDEEDGIARDFARLCEFRGDSSWHASALFVQR